MTPRMTQQNDAAMPAAPVESPEEPTGPPDLAAGYCIEFYVYGDGTYGVGEPHAIADKPDAGAEEDNEDTHIPDLTAALKRLLNVVKTNPIGEDENEQFNAGYNAGPAGGVA